MGTTPHRCTDDRLPGTHWVSNTGLSMTRRSWAGHTSSDVGLLQDNRSGAVLLALPDNLACSGKAATAVGVDAPDRDGIEGKPLPARSPGQSLPYLFRNNASGTSGTFSLNEADDCPPGPTGDSFPRRIIGAMKDAVFRNTPPGKWRIFPARELTADEGLEMPIN